LKIGLLLAKGTILFLFLLSAFFSGCSPALIRPLSPNRPEKIVLPNRRAFGAHRQYALVGSFSTGEKSYVRSLLADEETVWVGTTEGVI